MEYRLVAQGNASDFRTAVPRAEEEAVPEGSRVELQVHFRFRFPGFEELAGSVDYSLRNQYRVTPWPGEWQIITVDPEQPIWYVRWVKGVVWASVVVSAIWAAVALLAVLLFWRLYVVVEPYVKKYPWLLALLAGGVLVAVVAARSRGGPP